MTDSWQSFGITSRWILSRMPSFCSADEKNTMKALYFDRDGFVLLPKRLDNGKFQWSRNASEVRPLTRQEFRWLYCFLLISRKQYSQQKAKIFDLCNMQILKKFSTCETSLQWKISTYVKSQRALSVDRYAQVHNNVYNFTEKLQKPADL